MKYIYIYFGTSVHIQCTTSDMLVEILLQFFLYNFHSVCQLMDVVFLNAWPCD